MINFTFWLSTLVCILGCKCAGITSRSYRIPLSRSHSQSRFISYWVLSNNRIFISYLLFKVFESLHVSFLILFHQFYFNFKLNKLRTPIFVSRLHMKSSWKSWMSSSLLFNCWLSTSLLIRSSVSESNLLWLINP
jgi:hypothetical protein